MCTMESIFGSVMFWLILLLIVIVLLVLGGSYLRTMKEDAVDETPVNLAGGLTDAQVAEQVESYWDRFKRRKPFNGQFEQDNHGDVKYFGQGRNG